jgi:TolA-binding protein
MVRLCRFLLILLLAAAGARGARAASAAENRAFKAASTLLGLNSWPQAEKAFSEFVEKYPKSARVPEAILFQAEAAMSNHQYTAAVQLLATNQNRAGTLSNEYVFWIGQTHLINGNPAAAAETFHRLMQSTNVERRLDAAVGEATARSLLGEWARVAEGLQKQDGPFQQAARSGATNDLLSAGYLLLGESELRLKNFGETTAVLQQLNGQRLNPEQAWRRLYLECRLQLALGQVAEASRSAEALPGLAAPTGRADLMAQSLAFQADVFSRLNRIDDAIAAYEKILTNAPVELQRDALLRITDLNLSQQHREAAAADLQRYLEAFPHSGAADLARLTLGELLLKQAAQQTNADGVVTDTNLLTEPMAQFEQLLAAFPNSSLAGKAHLDLGWCLWLAGRGAESGDAFRRAAQELPFSEDQAVALFKWADAQLAAKDYAAAAGNFNSLVTRYAGVPKVRAELLQQALYQQARAAIEAGNIALAGAALDKVLAWYPNGFLGDNCLLLVGEGFAARTNTVRARQLFADFEKRAAPTNALLPEVRLALARTYEVEMNWPKAIEEYTAWTNRFAGHPKLPEAKFWLARDNSMAGRETNALALFTAFATEYPLHELTPRADWWMGDYYFNQGNYSDAENYYQSVFQNSNAPMSGLAYQAYLMAGRAAFARGNDYAGALVYFTRLTSNTNCPEPLFYEALIAAGDAEMNLHSDETNQAVDLKEAIRIFEHVPLTNELAAAALGEKGNCCLQLAANDPQWFDEAAKTYRQILALPNAPISARSQAQVGLGNVCRNRAESLRGDEQVAMLQQALDNYLDAFAYEKLLRDGEQPDLFWVKEAGLRAAEIAERVGQWPQAIDIYRKLATWLPELAPAMDKKIVSAQKNLDAGKHSSVSL